MPCRSSFYLSLVFLLISVQYVSANLTSKCRPEKGTNCTRNLAFGRLNEIRDEPSLRDNDGASINCKILGQEKFVNSEFILPSEPPYLVNLEIDSELSSLLHDSTILCSVDSISRINRPKPDEDDKYRGTGNILYNCSTGGVNLKIKFLGMSVLLRDSHGHGCKPLIFQAGSVDSCVKDTEVPSEKRSETGMVCVDNTKTRHMYINQTDFDCRQCCPGHYWSMNNEKCTKCDDDVTNCESNIWTQCYDFSSCQSSSTISPTTPKVQIAPGQPSIKHGNVTLMIFQWKPVKYVKNSPIEYYKVAYWIKGSSATQSVNTTMAEISIKNLRPCQDYEVKVGAGNSKGLGPWSDILYFQSPGKGPKRKPQNVTLSRRGKMVNISWGKITRTQDSFEEPISGVRIEYWPLGKTEKKQENSTKLDSSINITIGDESYNFSISTYNRCGTGPPVYKETSFIQAPSIAPGQPSSKHGHLTLMIFQWKPVQAVKNTPIDYYEVAYWINGSSPTQSVTTTAKAEVSIKNLRPCQDYDVKVRAGNSEGLGPWSDISHFQIPGKGPKIKPQNVTLSRRGKMVNISWDKITRMQDSFEEPISGVRIEYWPLGKTEKKQEENSTKLDSSINITIGDESYNFNISTYNRCGTGPPVYKETSSSQESNASLNTWIVGVVVGILRVGLLIVAGVVLYCKRKRNKRRPTQPPSQPPVQYTAVAFKNP